MWIDSHCHLDMVSNKLEKSSKDIIDSIYSGSQVMGMLSVNCNINKDFENIHNIAKNNKNVWCSIGTHPHEASDVIDKDYSVSDIIKNVSSCNKIIAVGESGLDYYYNNSSKEDQILSFRKHINAAMEANVPLIIHSRDADDELIGIIKEEGGGNGNLKAVMHCFSSSEKLAIEALEMGFYISFSGIITFNKSNELRDIAKKVPIDMVLVETDAPFLAPIPHRGKICVPNMVEHTGEVLSSLYDTSLTDFATISTDNFFKLFSKASLTYE